MTSAVLFDLDDTLLDHSGALRTGTSALYQHVNPVKSFDAFVRAWEVSLKRQFDRYLAGEVSYSQQRCERIREVVDASLSDGAAEELFGVYLKAYEGAWTLFPETIGVLDRLSSRPLGIVTNGQGEQQRRKLQQTGILDLFDCVVISEEHGVAKPHPSIFLSACALLGEEPGNIAYVGDRYDLDAEAARSIGMRGIWLDRGRAASVEHRPPVIHSLADLPDLLGDVTAKA